MNPRPEPLPDGIMDDMNRGADRVWPFGKATRGGARMPPADPSAHEVRVWWTTDDRDGSTACRGLEAHWSRRRQLDDYFDNCWLEWNDIAVPVRAVDPRGEPQRTVYAMPVSHRAIMFTSDGSLPRRPVF